MPKKLHSFGKQSLTLSERRKSGHLALLKSSFNLCHSCPFFSCQFQKPCFAVITFKPLLIEHLTDFGKILRAHMRKHLNAHTHTRAHLTTHLSIHRNWRKLEDFQRLTLETFNSFTRCSSGLMVGMAPVRDLKDALKALKMVHVHMRQFES